MPELVGLADDQHADGARQALDSGSAIASWTSTREAAEHFCPA